LIGVVDLPGEVGGPALIQLLLQLLVPLRLLLLVLLLLLLCRAAWEGWPSREHAQVMRMTP
jgi:hypothetical protein